MEDTPIVVEENDDQVSGKFKCAALDESEATDGVCRQLEALTATADEIMDEHSCEPCLSEDEVVRALGFCRVCLEYLCEGCMKSHRKSKLTRGHKLLTGADIPADIKLMQVIAGMVACTDHPDKEVGYFCGDHQTHICAECVSKSHRKCDKLEDIEEVKNPERDKMFMEESCVNLRSLRQSVADDRNKKDKDLKYMNAEQRHIEEGRHCFAHFFYKMLTEDGDTSQEDMNGFMVDKTTKLEQVIEELKGFESELTNTLDIIVAAMQHGSENQIHVVAFQIAAQFQTVMQKMDSQGAEGMLSCEVSMALSATRNLFDSRQVSGQENDHTSNQGDAETERNSGQQEQTTYFKSDMHEGATADSVNQVDEISQEVKIDKDSDTLETVGTVERTVSINEEQLQFMREMESDDADSIFYSQTNGIESQSTKSCQTENVYVSSISAKTTINKRGNNKSKPKPVRNVPVPPQIPLRSRSINYVNKHAVSCPGDTDTCSIISMAILPGRRIILIDIENKKVKVYNGDFKFLSQFRLDFQPADICHVEGDIFVVVGENFMKQYKLDRYSVKFIKSCSSKMACYAVSKYYAELAILCVDHGDCKIQIRQPNSGKIVKAIDTFKDNPNLNLAMDPVALKYSHRHGFLIGERKSRLRCFHHNGVQKWDYQGRWRVKLSFVNGLAEDPEGNLYVCGQESGNVHQISGENVVESRVIADLAGARSVVFDEAERRIIVGCNTDDHVYVYKLA